MPKTIIENHARLLEQAEARLELQRRGIEKACKESVVSHRAGPMYWLRELTKTENYHWREQGLQPVMPFPFRPFTDRKIDVSVFPFPHEFGVGEPCERCAKLGFESCVPDYLDVIMGLLLTSKIIFIPKTREMMTSWLVTGYLTWMCQFFEKTEWVSQSEDDLKAQGLVKYSGILYVQQPPWMRLNHPLARGEEGTLHKIEWASGSSFIAMPSGERKLASKHPYGFFLDEAAHIPAAEATINIAMPAVKQIIAVSSVAPGWFADICGC